MVTQREIELIELLRDLLYDRGPEANGVAAAKAANVVAEYDMGVLRNSAAAAAPRTPRPLIAALCSCGSLMNGIHDPLCQNRPRRY